MTNELNEVPKLELNRPFHNVVVSHRAVAKAAIEYVDSDCTFESFAKMVIAIREYKRMKETLNAQSEK